MTKKIHAAFYYRLMKNLKINKNRYANQSINSYLKEEKNKFLWKLSFLFFSNVY